ncbi:MAG: alpha/beta hydrolase [Cyclobacteriaceae bacterium]|nr:MAG: alpha/beta hydrolase [Cyclobacteriaceae bacterium]
MAIFASIRSFKLVNEMHYVSDNFFSYKNIVLQYYKIGNGAKALICFHGFGQEGTAYLNLAEKNGDQYTFYSFDLPFHGRSSWTLGDKPIEKKQWLEFIGAFITEQGIKKFALAGFSLGARFVLVMTECFSNQIDRLYLIAPDGIKPSTWYTLATSTALGRSFFKSMIFNPHRFFNLARIVAKLNLVDKRLIRFAISQMDTVNKRTKVYHAWVVFRKLSISRANLIRNLNQHNLPVTLILGDGDRMITKKHVKQILKNVHTASLVILPSSHHALLSVMAKTGLPE